MKKIKSFFANIKNKIKSFFSFIGSKIAHVYHICMDAIKNLFHKIAESKFGKKVGPVVTFIPRKFGELTNHTRKTIWGIIFVLPLLIGFVYFFLIPFIYTIWFSLGFIESGGSVGLKVSFVGIKNYIYVFTEATATPRGESELTFLEFLTQSIISILTDIPIILIFSLIMAVVLNSKFKGRAFVRAVFFVPVIFNSQAIDVATKAYTVLDESTSGATKDLFEQMFSFKDFLTNANFPKWLVDFLGNASQKIYDIIAYSGIQILIFLSAIQSVPRHLYEAAKMEGATQYEMFWKITFPMVSPMLLAAAVYTVVDSFLRSPMITILDKFSKPGTQEVTSEDLGLLIDGKNVLSNYGIGASISLIFTVVIGILLAIVLGVLSKVVFYYDE